MEKAGIKSALKEDDGATSVKTKDNKWFNF